MADPRIETLELTVPDHEEVAKVLQAGLEKNFESASVTYEDCPDLRKKPYSLVSEGICGNPALLDVGAVDYLLPLPQLNKIYNLGSIAKAVGYSKATIIGAGAGGHHIVGVNCELMANIRTGDEEQLDSYTAKVDLESGGCVLQKYPHKEFCLLGNFLVSEGRTGKVFKITARKRKGAKNFVSCLREALRSHYKEKPVALGGVFVIAKGKANLHVMPLFSSTPLNSPAEVDKWLKFYDMHSPLTCLSVLISHDPGLDLRVEHTHCFSDHGEGGHYHDDTTPEEVEYEAYYGLAEKLYRVDRP